MDDFMSPGRHRIGFGKSVVHLCGHVLGSAVLFLAIATASWGLGLAVSALNSIHPFQGNILALLHSVETWLLYVDIGLSGVVLLAGAWRFLMELGGRS